MRTRSRATRLAIDTLNDADQGSVAGRRPSERAAAVSSVSSHDAHRRDSLTLGHTSAGRARRGTGGARHHGRASEVAGAEPRAIFHSVRDGLRGGQRAGRARHGPVPRRRSRAMQGLASLGDAPSPDSPRANAAVASGRGRGTNAPTYQLNPEVNAFQRYFVNEVRRCEEMERKLRTPAFGTNGHKGETGDHRQWLSVPLDAQGGGGVRGRPTQAS